MDLTNLIGTNIAHQICFLRNFFYSFNPVANEKKNIDCKLSLAVIFSLFVHISVKILKDLLFLFS